ncbi:hypothetical protein E2C01_078399 [Portunus trituberculatus]|uniref:Uncharacterized protein n=1 Tax=Portunus trituberculatus TaxID=210409 RepID=A0A5B7IU18_PORTR|nr:hypothetical protein [Portunus trituberculatus]
MTIRRASGGHLLTEARGTTPVTSLDAFPEFASLMTMYVEIIEMKGVALCKNGEMEERHCTRPTSARFQSPSELKPLPEKQ